MNYQNLKSVLIEQLYDLALHYTIKDISREYNISRSWLQRFFESRHIDYRQVRSECIRYYIEEHYGRVPSSKIWQALNIGFVTFYRELNKIGVHHKRGGNRRKLEKVRIIEQARLF